jgi:hypothetical protein
MSTHHGRRKPISNEKRERDVFLLYGAAFRDIPSLDELGPNSETCSLPGNHVPQPSRDSTLTALAQLATLRIGAERAMISLIDDQRQYILAEATPNMCVHPETPGDNDSSSLWLGSASIPRTWASRHVNMIPIFVRLTSNRYVNLFLVRLELAVM